MCQFYYRYYSISKKGKPRRRMLEYIIEVIILHKLYTLIINIALTRPLNCATRT